jgi:sec-independent protein translocase protein TatA
VPFGIGIWELVILMVVLLLVFGAKRLPEMGKSIGHGMREFKDAVTGHDEPEKTELTPPPPVASTVPPPAPPAEPETAAPPPAQPSEPERVETERVSS